MIALKISFIFLSISPLFLLEKADSAKILYLYSYGCKSTASMHRAISKILLNNHHELIVISPFPLDENFANYTDLNVHDEFFQFSDRFPIEDTYTGTYYSRTSGYQIQNSNCENFYQNYFKLNEKLKNTRIDLILWEIENEECFLPFLAKFQAPIIGVSAGNILFPEIDGLMGNPVNPSYMPGSMSGFSSRMNFIQRLLNTKDYVLHLLINWYYIREADIIVGKYFKSPPIHKLYDQIALVFFNSHFSFLPKTMGPGTVDIAGIHIEKLTPLPKEIQSFIESSSRVLYLSLGSVAKFSELPKNIYESLVKILQKLPYRVILRHDKPEMMQNASKNILARKWLPQKEILAHPNVILFISHCGMFSILEAINFGVPVLAFPTLYDQFKNAAIVENLQIGVTLDWRAFKEKALLSSIEEVIQNEKYRENIKKLSSIFRDRPQSCQDTLLYWINYVLEHKDVSHLKAAETKLSFYQYLLLDVILFSSLILAMISLIIYFIFKNTALILRKLMIKTPV